MKVGILELLAYPATDLWEYVDSFWSNKQYSSVTAQTISTWCRQMGHQVHFAPYYGWGDPQTKLPDDLDVVFIASHTYTAPLAYALGKRFKMENVRTVIGGPHAKSFPQDCLRYFDLVVLDCDRELIAGVIADRFAPETIISSHSPFGEVPLIEERLPEIKAATFVGGHPHPGSFVPMLSSMGCPYACDFCCDWDSPYRPLSLERLAADLHFAADQLPGIKLVFHDPSFGLRFDEVMAVLESMPPGKRNPYVMETTLSALHPGRLERLRQTNCVCVLPSIESWTAYSSKSGVGKVSAAEKLDQMVEAFETLSEYVPYLGTNFILGFDHDSGREPFELTKEFLLRAPFVWPTLNVPIPFGGTPMFERFSQQGRILKTMPFSFYRLPNVTILFKNYDPITYMQYMVDLYAAASSKELLRRRLECSANALAKGIQFLRTVTARRRHKGFKGLLERFKSDPQFLAFHSGETDVLPACYARAYRRIMGKYAELVPVEDSCPLAR